MANRLENAVDYVLSVAESLIHRGEKLLPEDLRRERALSRRITPEVREVFIGRMVDWACSRSWVESIDRAMERDEYYPDPLHPPIQGLIEEEMSKISLMADTFRGASNRQLARAMISFWPNLPVGD